MRADELDPEDDIDLVEPINGEANDTFEHGSDVQSGVRSVLRLELTTICTNNVRRSTEATELSIFLVIGRVDRIQDRKRN